MFNDIYFLREGTTMGKFFVRCFLVFMLFVSGSALVAEEEKQSENYEEQLKSIQEFPDPFKDIRRGTGEPVPTEDFTGELFKMLSVLGLILLIMLGVSYLIRYTLNVRVQQANVGSSIKILERRYLGPKSAIYLLEIGGKVYAVGESGNGLTLLGSVDQDLSDFKAVLDEKMHSDE